MSAWDALIITAILFGLWGVVPGGALYLIVHGQRHPENALCTRLCKEEEVQ